ncbi:exopolyphosphatase [Pseudoteredinibacter isoporae]|uniref:NanoRNase/pAp phosphatase (C-di-AMP/oligoRNAs hydrolase) n=1 Tax=Pseudoteredinibacter isoporae TaxID=570281 RepID=A0A7X0JUR2_9GAMM|nr:exopolyphosphatase [Pseudoteredinibacter isoporae]MBB6522624.1 nanoRNase/pAp phosphatase (c-di-AMP/oligoRNAs hydrolase) [Pseudoteredinibacter isoporae]NHO88154.1 exopolyphosphatase [Pseudoteredinibacter isoporae]NIB23515.1 exopolyphosphatase [Pseudoteredinibacter isoporae]
MTTKQYRLVTRSDFDGLVCAVLLKHLDIVSDIKFVHPKDMQDGKVDIDDNDITTNLPYVPAVHLAFDHHHSEAVRNDAAPNYIIDPEAPSAARVVFDHYGGFDVFPRLWEEMMEAVDKADSAQYEREDIVNPKNWELLNFIMDARTGLGRFREFRISNYELMMQLIDYCANHNIDEILELPDVKERVDMYREHHLLFMDQIKQNSTVHGNLVVLDLQAQDPIWAGNRFMIYALYPEVNISIHRMWGLKQQNTVFAVGKSILDRSSQTNVGELMLKYGGGGHLAAGTCQIENDKADEVLEELIASINADG